MSWGRRLSSYHRTCNIPHMVTPSRAPCLSSCSFCAQKFFSPAWWCLPLFLKCYVLREALPDILSRADVFSFMLPWYFNFLKIFKSLNWICYNIASVFYFGCLALRHAVSQLLSQGLNLHHLPRKVRFQPLNYQGRPHPLVFYSSLQLPRPLGQHSLLAGVLPSEYICI